MTYQFPKVPNFLPPVLTEGVRHLVMMPMGVRHLVMMPMAVRHLGLLCTVFPLHQISSTLKMSSIDEDEENDALFFDEHDEYAALRQQPIKGCDPKYSDPSQSPEKLCIKLIAATGTLVGGACMMNESHCEIYYLSIMYYVYTPT